MVFSKSICNVILSPTLFFWCFTGAAFLPYINGCQNPNPLERTEQNCVDGVDRSALCHVFKREWPPKIKVCVYTDVTGCIGGQRMTFGSQFSPSALITQGVFFLQTSWPGSTPRRVSRQFFLHFQSHHKTFGVACLIIRCVPGVEFYLSGSCHSYLSCLPGLDL